MEIRHYSFSGIQQHNTSSLAAFTSSNRPTGVLWGASLSKAGLCGLHPRSSTWHPRTRRASVYFLFPWVRSSTLHEQLAGSNLLVDGNHNPSAAWRYPVRVSPEHQPRSLRQRIHAYRCGRRARYISRAAVTGDNWHSIPRIQRSCATHPVRACGCRCMPEPVRQTARGKI